MGKKHRAMGTAACLIAIMVVAVAGLVAWMWPRLFPSPLEKAQAAYEQGNWSAAATMARGILRERPGDVAALRLLARTQGRIGRDESAQELFNRVSDHAMQAEDFFLLGAGLVRQERAEAALAVLERARTLDPSHAEALHELARTYARLGRLGDAVEAASQLVAVPGWEARGGVILGALCQERLDSSVASKALIRALQADPRLHGAVASPSAVRKLLARTLLQTRQPSQAKTYLETVLLDGPDPEASWLMSRAYLLCGDVPKAAQALTSAAEYAAADPLRSEPAPYVGSKACSQCHASIFRLQQNSRHARTFVLAKDLADMPLPAQPVPDPAVPGLTHAFRHEGEAIRLETRVGNRVRSAIVEYALGSDHHGQTMIGRDEKGKDRVFRLSSFDRHSLWDLTPNVPRPRESDPDEVIGQYLSADSVVKCVDCHVTSIRAARDRGVPEAADRGIGCERCHGPGGNHLAAVAARFDDLAIGRPSMASSSQITRLCAGCHNSSNPSIPANDPLTIRLQTLTMPRSRCYAESGGRLSCLTCHDPHRDAESSAAHYEGKCLSCHGSEGARKAVDSSHAPLPVGARQTSCPVNPTHDCLKCHMPATPSPAHHTAFTDHHIRIHRPQESAH
jgi:tetratricopeptide (TPR) repeat protein